MIVIFEPYSRFDQCETSISSSSNGFISFHNTVLVVSRKSYNELNHSIQIRSNLNLDVTCSYDPKVTTGDHVTVEKAGGNGVTTAEGHFQFYAAYYDESYTVKDWISKCIVFSPEVTQYKNSAVTQKT